MTKRGKCGTFNSYKGGSSSVGRASASQAGGRGFDSRLPLHLIVYLGDEVYAVVRIGGMQYRVAPQERLRVPRLQADEGQTLKFKEVLLVEVDGDVLVGTPTVRSASVRAKVLGHGKGEKVIVFKMKRRKKYRRKRGHRQPYTEIIVEDITLEEEGDGT